jgi:hypothetical protein
MPAVRRWLHTHRFLDSASISTGDPSTPLRSAQGDGCPVVSYSLNSACGAVALLGMTAAEQWLELFAQDPVCLVSWPSSSS